MRLISLLWSTIALLSPAQQGSIVDIRWTYADMGARALPAVHERVQLGRHRLELRTGAWCRFDQRPTNHPHRHDGFFECCLIADGQGDYQHGGNHTPLGPGSLIVSDPGAVHEITSATRDLILVYWTMRIDSTNLPTGSWDETLVDAFIDHHHHHVPEADEVLRLWLPLAAGGGPLAQRRRHQLLVQVSLEAMAALAVAPPAEPLRQNDDHAVALAVSYIDAHRQRAIAARDVAAAAHLSERHLRRLFQAQFGCGIAEVVAERRFNYAAQHLLHGASARDAAHAIGINDASQFGRQFKRRFGCTPLAYQRRHRVSPSVPMTTHTPSNEPPQP